MKLDLHVHTGYSRDATPSAIEIVKRCKSIGLDGVAITDHNEIKGSLEAYSVAASEGVVVVRGVEVSAKEGHVLALGIGELVPRGLPLRDTVDKIRAAGGVAVAAHPGRFPSGMGIERARVVDVDAIEVLNGGTSSHTNTLARAVAEHKGVAMTGGSDAHGIGELGKAWTIVEDASSEEDVIRAIEQSKCSVGGRSRTVSEGYRYSIETLVEWLKGDLKRL